MILHPDHAIDLAAIRHRELVAQADEFRAAVRAGDPAARTPDYDCRVPTAAPQPICRPDPRPAAAGRVGRRRPHPILRGHRKPRRVR